MRIKRRLSHPFFVILYAHARNARFSDGPNDCSTRIKVVRVRVWMRERGTTSKFNAMTTHCAAREIDIHTRVDVKDAKACSFVRSFVRNHAEITTRGLRRGVTRIDDDAHA